MEPLTSSVTLDWITLTTWDIPTFFDIVSYIRSRHMGGWSPYKVMQYKGQTNGNIFYGTGEQKNKQGETVGHAMLRVSGNQADEVFYQDLIWYFRRSDITLWRCSRIDLESTKTPPKRYNLMAAYKRIRKPKKIISEENTTLYIGSRSDSPIYVRLYEKLGYLRLEFELKQYRAQWAFEKLCDGIHPNDIYAHCLAKSRVPVMYANRFQPEKHEPVDFKMVERQASLESKMQWLSSIEPALARMCADHDIGLRTQVILSRILLAPFDLDQESDNK